MPAARTLTLTALAAIAVTGVLGAAEPIQYQQSFDGLTLGPIAGQDSWYNNAVVQNTVAVAGNAMLVNAGGGERNVTALPQTFSSLTDKPIQVLSFDLRLPTVITDFSGTPNQDIQETIQFRGPRTNQEFFFVYKAFTNGSGVVTQNRFEFRSGGTTLGSPSTVLKDTWYHVAMLINFDKRTLDGLMLNPDGSLFWDPAPITGFGNNGNINYVGFFSDSTPPAPLYVDNVLVLLPEPAGLSLLGLGALALLRRRVR